jgi:hypothetical protein
LTAVARVAFAPALTVTALSALVARTWATCACVASAPITSRRAALAASGIPVPAACASGVARPAITTLSAAVSIGTTFSTPGAFPASIALAAAASTPIAPGAITALGEGCPIEDGQAGAMAEVKLNPKGESGSGACYRNQDMSPPTCHDHLMKASMLGFANCSAAS